MLNDVIIAIVILSGLGLIFATILAIAYRKFRVYEDPRIDAVEELLPGSNCGACSMPGCRAFAEKVIEGDIEVSRCTVSSPGGIEAIASYLGVDAGNVEKRVARLLCAGGKSETHNRASYKRGLSTCRGEAVVAGGPKDCNWGCLGLGDCDDVCDFDAIFMNDDDLPVVIPDKCTACGDCVDICPKNLFTIMPVSQKLIVQCRSLLEGTLATDRCTVACNACGKCAVDAAPDLIEISNGLAVIDYELNHLAGPEAVKRCPTNAIVWLNSDAQFATVESDVMPLGRVDSQFDSETYYQ
jgi:Na+-translocating ferredoxin:NAD+ oxidoreductase RNF subunit RnfB